MLLKILREDKKLEPKILELYDKIVKAFENLPEISGREEEKVDQDSIDSIMEEMQKGTG